ncbi:hypothetical protein ABPG77_005913 [Micractinium sp. CCAP 211/92]
MPAVLRRRAAGPDSGLSSSGGSGGAALGGPAAQSPALEAASAAPVAAGTDFAAAAGPSSGGAAAAAHSAAVAAVSTPSTARRRPTRSRAQSLLPWELVPDHYRDNTYIRAWYRPPGGFRNSLASLFRLHNESGNIWTHLVGFIIFIFLTTATVHVKPVPLRLGAEAVGRLEHKLMIYGKGNLLELVQTLESWEQRVVRYGQAQLAGLEEGLRSIGTHNLQELLHVPDALRSAGQSGWQELSGVAGKIRSVASEVGGELAQLESQLEAAIHDALAAALEAKWPVSRWPIYVFTAGAMVCLLTSAVCHLFGCCAAHITAVMWRFDYAGIAVLIVASFFPPVYFGFMCAPWTRLFYLTTTSLLGLATLCVTLLSAFQKAEYQTRRALLFVLLGLWGVVPMLHGWALNGGAPEVTRALLLDVVMGAIYIGGAAIYALRWPERLKPGAFDVAFHSHQLFHVAVVVAACVHYKAVRILLDWRDASGGCLPPIPTVPLAATLPGGVAAG